MGKVHNGSAKRQLRDAGEPLSPQAAAICGRRRGRTGWLPNLCVPALPARLVQLHVHRTASGNRGANRSEWERPGGEDDRGATALSN